VTASSIQPANGGDSDAFVTKINAAGTAILYSTFLGGHGADEGNGIAVDGAGNAYVAGDTSSSTFPGVTASSIQPANGGGVSDAFVTKIGYLGLAFFIVTPCRVVDTRGATGTFGGPPIPASGGTRTFPFVSAGCSVPAAARAVSINITVVNAGAVGYLDLFSGDLTVAPLSSNIDFSIGQTRANNSVVQVSTDGNGKLTVFNSSSASVDIVIDVNGYFR
jgi:hypothetical protein